ncbi:MAG: NAD-dependent epimerase/dehydratase family protein [Nibricoccus sp.]
MKNHFEMTLSQTIEWILSTPTPAVIDAVRELEGNFVILGVGGKMGATTALMLRRALDAAGRGASLVTGVSRFSNPDARRELEAFGIRTVACDLAEPDDVARLDDAAHVIFLAGQKFGTDGAPEATWVQNTVVPALVARRFRTSRIVVFSTGCVYPFARTDGPGSSEREPLAFQGEYASSCIGRERVFTYHAQRFGTRQLIFRLNYATELRYGVLVDIAQKVLGGQAVDLTTGWLNCIWQGDACARAIQSLAHVSNPPKLLNVTGAEKLSVRMIAEEFGRRFGREPVFTGRESDTAWLADASESVRLFGEPTVSLPEMLDLTADYVRQGGRLLGKPTHFETRSGRF